MFLRIGESGNSKAVHITGYLGADLNAVTLIHGHNPFKVRIVGDNHLYDSASTNAPDALDCNRSRFRHVRMLVYTASELTGTGRCQNSARYQKQLE